jgi:hypothetical protein
MVYAFPKCGPDIALLAAGREARCAIFALPYITEIPERVRRSEFVRIWTKQSACAEGYPAELCLQYLNQKQGIKQLQSTIQLSMAGKTRRFAWSKLCINNKRDRRQISADGEGETWKHYRGKPVRRQLEIV